MERSFDPRCTSLIIVLISIIFISGNAFALNPGTPFTFSNTVYPGATNLWTHTLLNTNFDPDLSGGEVLDVMSGEIDVNFTYIPDPLSKSGHFLVIIHQDLDDFRLDTFQENTTNGGPNTVTWSSRIKGAALEAIEDRYATIELIPIKGSIERVNYSALSGGGVVAPEPVSMVLVGIGMICLPLARAMRRNIRGQGLPSQ